MDYIELKRKVLEKYFSRMNDRQRQAVFNINGALLIIAGAGSGKTTVLCNRIANMLLFGNAYNTNTVKELSEDDERFALDYLDGGIENSEAARRLSEIFSEGRVMPWNILAVTFTNKAAGELKNRLANMGADSDGIWARTFHSACVSILRKDIEALGGYTRDFTIYDTDDSEKVIKTVMKDLEVPEKTFAPKTLRNIISSAKDKLITPDGFSAKRGAPTEPDDYMLATAKRVYTHYQRSLEEANALDFDDIIMLTVRLFSERRDILEYWQNKFRYIMVDEYQDTNAAQYKLVSLLAGSDGNLCVVGDEDQSIYRFRGATIENILSFEEEFSADVVKLEQNYRSTTNILNAANAVISNNLQHKEKRLWSDLGEGEKIVLERLDNEQEEGRYVAQTILEGRKAGRQFSMNAVLYRSNAQSGTVERYLSVNGIPYKVIGGLRFYERKEIKDMIAYLSIINNPYDEVRFSRVINEPSRGIGAATLNEIRRIAAGMGMSYIDVCYESPDLPTLQKKSKVLRSFAENIKELIPLTDDLTDTSIIDEILERFDYLEALKKEGLEGETRLENINELKSDMIAFANENEGASLSDFLEQAALVADIDSYEEEDDKVVLMTMHAAKGLEFDTVFIIGAEENVFPSYRSSLDPIEIEEERRLAYVAITRAKRRLFVTCARSRMLYGQTSRNKVSRFITEIPAEYMDYVDSTSKYSLGAQKSTPDADRPVGYYGKPKRENYLEKQNTRYEKQKAASGGSGSVSGFEAGCRVRHGVFGEGVVVSATPLGNDFLLEIAFDKTGTKKLAAKFAKLEKI